jgi:hypothetical protein
MFYLFPLFPNNALPGFNLDANLILFIELDYFPYQSHAACFTSPKLFGALLLAKAPLPTVAADYVEVIEAHCEERLKCRKALQFCRSIKYDSEWTW